MAEDTYAHYTFRITAHPGRSLTDKGYDALEDALDKIMDDALAGVWEKLLPELPMDVEDAISVHWRRE